MVRFICRSVAVSISMSAALAFASVADAEQDTLWIESQQDAPPVELQLPSFAPVIEKLGKAVVNISTEGQQSVPVPRRRQDSFSGRGQNDQPSPFDYFFQVPPGGGQKRSFKTHSLGSGFVIHPDGYIVTNNHVIERATKILVTFRDDKHEYPAKVIGLDKKTDLALLKVDTDRPLDAVVLGESENVVPGDWVIAIGNPFRLGHTVTVGIVSAKSRKVPGGGPYDDFIQTDASINPGNSGGPLFNARGEVVGVNTAIFSPGSLGSSGFNIGIGFAIPVDLVKGIIKQLHEGGKVTRGWLGVLIQPVSEDVATAMKLKSASGALVADVLDNSPAAKSGLKRGDVIVGFDKRKVEENDDLPLMVAQTKIGRAVSVDVIRKGSRKALKVTIEELKEPGDERSIKPTEESKLGLTAQDLTPDIARSLGVEETEGVVVSNVVPDGAAEVAGLRRGDIILEVGSRSVKNAEKFRAMTEGLVEGKPLLLLVRRGDNTIFLTLKLE